MWKCARLWGDSFSILLPFCIHVFSGWNSILCVLSFLFGFHRLLFTFAAFFRLTKHFFRVESRQPGTWVLRFSLFDLCVCVSFSVESTHWSTVLHNHQPIFVLVSTLCVCHSIHSVKGHIFRVLFITVWIHWTTEHACTLWESERISEKESERDTERTHISMIYYLFRISFSFFPSFRSFIWNEAVAFVAEYFIAFVAVVFP